MANNVFLDQIKDNIHNWFVRTKHEERRRDETGNYSLYGTRVVKMVCPGTDKQNGARTRRYGAKELNIKLCPFATDHDKMVGGEGTYHIL